MENIGLLESIWFSDPHSDYCSSLCSNCNVQYSNSLQILQNRLARVLVSADIRTRIIDQINTLNWNKLDQRWKLHLLHFFKCLKGDAPVYLSPPFSFATHSHHTRGQTFNTLIVPSWKYHSGKITFYYRASKLWNNLPNDVCCNDKSMSLHFLKKFWLLYNELYYIFYVCFIYLFITFLKGKLCWYFNKVQLDVPILYLLTKLQLL